MVFDVGGCSRVGGTSPGLFLGQDSRADARSRRRVHELISEMFGRTALGRL